VGLVLLTRVGEFRQQQFNALHDQIDVGFPTVGGGGPASVSACASLSLVRIGNLFF
jgi:formiminotetrahydrofolate cyclodeaminase